MAPQITIHYQAPTVCCGVTQDKALGVVLLALALMVAATAAWLFGHGFGDIPPFITGCVFSVAAVGLTLVSIGLLARRSMPTNLS